MITWTSRTFRLFVLLAMVILLTACGGEDAVSALPTSTHTPPPSPTTTLTPTLPPTATVAMPHRPTTQPTETPSPTHTPTPTDAASPTPTWTPTATPTETAVPLITVPEGGYAFQPWGDFLVNVQGPQTGITSPDDEILLFMIANNEGTEETLSEILDGFISAVSADAGELTRDDTFPLVIAEVEGVAADVSGQFLGETIQGRIVVIAPNESSVFLAYGFAVNDRWESEGLIMYEAILGTLSFDMENAPDSPAATGATASPTPATNSDFLLPMPTGEPATEWSDLPIMPDALAGEEGDGSYSFTITAAADTVQAFYETEMAALGWSLLGVGEGANGGLLLIFQKDTAVASISIFTLDGGTIYVFLVK